MSFTVQEIVQGVRAGAIAATSVVEHYLDAISAADGEIEAWVTVDGEGARAAAKALAGRDCSDLPLAGVPVGLKDIIDVASLPTTAGSAEFAHRVPDEDAPVTRQLKDAGAIILGKTATTEFAYGAPASTRNPWNLEHTPGGSSSGSAAVVASGMVTVALGSQTVGSVLRPAAFCGIVGFKPSFGAISTEGVVPLSWSLDHVGVFGRSVADVGAVFEVVGAGSASQAGAGGTRPRIGVLRTYGAERVEAGLAAHLAEVADSTLAGVVDCVDAEIPDLDEWMAAGQVILAADAATYHAGTYFPEHEQEYRDLTVTLIRQGLGTSATDYINAQRARADLRMRIVSALGGFDALMLPVAPGPAPRSLESTGDPAFCAPASFSGLPSISLPTAVGADGLPLAVQFIGRPGGDQELLALAGTVEGALGFADEPTGFIS